MNSWLRFGASLLLLLPIAVQLTAQEIEEQETVVLRDVRVHVYDKSGNPVKGLEASDFTVYENDQEVQLSAFEELDLRQPLQAEPEAVEQDGDVPVPSLSHATEQRYVVVVLNSAYMTKRDFKRGVEELEAFAKTLLDGRTKVKIVQIDEQMRHLTGFTTSAVDIDLGMAKVDYEADLRKRITILERNIVDNIENYSRTAETEAFRSSQGASIQGEGMAENYKRLINMKIDEKALLKESYYRSFYLNMMLLAQTLKPINGSKSIFMLTGGSFLDPGQKFGNTKLMAEKLGRTLNDANVTIYSHLTKSLNNVADQALMMSRSSLDTIGGRRVPLSQLKQASSFGDPTDGDPIDGRGDSWNTVFENDLQLETGPSYAAETTGGLFHASTSARAIGETLREFDQKSKQYYRLNYTRFLEDVKKQARVKIEVRGAKTNDWKVVYGSSFEPRVPYSELEGDERALAFEAQLLHGETSRNDLNLETGFNFFRSEKKKLRIPVYAALPVEKFPANGFEFGFVALGKDDSLLDITKAEIPQAKDQQDLLIYDVLLVPEMPAELRFYARNLSNNEMTFEAIALDPASQVPELGPITLSASDDAQVVALNHLREAEPLRKEQDPFVIGNSLFKPSTNASFKKPAALSYFLHLDDPKERTYRLEATLLKDDQPIAIEGHQIKLLKDVVSGNRFYGQFNAGQLAAGDYTLNIRIIATDNNQTWQRQKTFEIQ